MIDKMLSVFGEFNSVGLMVIIGSIIVAGLNHFLKKNEEENKLGKGWKCKIRKGFQIEYLYFLIFLFLVYLVLPIFLDFLAYLLFYNTNKQPDITIIYKISLVLELIIGSCYIKLLNREYPKYKLKDKIANRINNNELEKRIKNIILILVLAIPSVLLFAFGFDIQWIKDNNYIFGIGAIILEVVGALVFDDKLIYPYETAEIYLDDNIVYKNVKVKSIGKNGKWIFFVSDEEKEVRILQDKLYKIEYSDKQF